MYLSDLNVDLKLQLSQYWYDHYISIYLVLLKLSKHIYPILLYTLRRDRYILTIDEITQYNNLIAEDIPTLMVKPAPSTDPVEQCRFNCKIENYIQNKLLQAANVGYLQALKYLVSIGVDIFYDDDQVFQNAARYGQLRIMKYLNKQGIDISSIYHSCTHPYKLYDVCMEDAQKYDYQYIIKYLTLIKDTDIAN